LRGREVASTVAATVPSGGSGREIIG